jgi:uroporphyrinogen-III decarboxylase
MMGELDGKTKGEKMPGSNPQNKALEFEPSPEFLAREKRLDDALNLRKPDRVPVAPLVVHYYPTRIKGISNKEAMYETEKTTKAWEEAAIQHNWDVAVPFGALRPARPLEILGLKQFKWPGGGLRDNQPFQWVEDEYVRAEEYDEMLTDPNGFAVKKLWPRISDTLGPVSGLAEMPTPPLLFLSNAYSLPEFMGDVLSQPSMTELLKKMLALAEAHSREKALRIRYTREMMALGFPVSYGAITFPAFDWIADTLRGMKGSMLDMYRVPEKLLAAVDLFTPLTIGGCLMAAEEAQNKGVFIPMHRGAAGFMSNKQFAKFYWPCFKALLLGLIDAGLTPMPLFEGDYTPRLEFLQELPPKKILGHFDQVDRKKAKKLIGDTMCFWGNVPASLMCTGTPKQIKDDVKELIDIFGDNGGLIIDCSMGIPDEAKPENVQALTEVVQEYRVY